VDFTRLPNQRGLPQRICTALDLFPCDILFVHRDAEGQAPDLRRDEIQNAVSQSQTKHIPVVPVRMTEAWLLHDEKAIRSAAGNPNGTEPLHLPELRRIEQIHDPKQVLHEVLVQASGLSVRRRQRFPVGKRVHLIPNYIDDYSRLMILHAFARLQQDIRNFLVSGPPTTPD
jgi:hypothetical protein